MRVVGVLSERAQQLLNLERSRKGQRKRKGQVRREMRGSLGLGVAGPAVRNAMLLLSLLLSHWLLHVKPAHFSLRRAGA